MKWIKENLTLVLLGIGLFLAGLVLVLIGVAYITTHPWNIVITNLGSVMIGAGVVELVITFLMSQRLIKDVVEQFQRTLKLPIVAFYENREALVPLWEELKDVSELWVAWHSGRVALTKGIFGSGRVSKAILTHPESAMMKELEKVSEMTANAIATDIRESTRALKQQEVPIRWFNGPVCNSVIIANPQRADAWIRVEVLVPTESTDKRPSFRIEKNKNRELFDTFFDAFEQMWCASEIPPETK